MGLPNNSQIFLQMRDSNTEIATSFAMGRGLAPVARHLILRDPPTPESAQQQECLQFADTDSLKVVTSQDENCVFLIGSLDFEHVCDLVFGGNLGNGDAPWAILSFDPGPP